MLEPAARLKVISRVKTTRGQVPLQHWQYRLRGLV